MIKRGLPAIPVVVGAWWLAQGRNAGLSAAVAIALVLANLAISAALLSWAAKINLGRAHGRRALRVPAPLRRADGRRACTAHRQLDRAACRLASRSSSPTSACCSGSCASSLRRSRSRRCAPPRCPPSLPSALPGPRSDCVDPVGRERAGLEGVPAARTTSSSGAPSGLLRVAAFQQDRADQRRRGADHHRAVPRRRDAEGPRAQGRPERGRDHGRASSTRASPKK